MNAVANWFEVQMVWRLTGLSESETSFSARLPSK